MGRQINFYMSQNIQDNFIEYLAQNQFLFLDSHAKLINQPTAKDVFDLYLYKKDYGDIIMQPPQYLSISSSMGANQQNIDFKHSAASLPAENMNSIKSPVIQFSKTVMKEEQKKVLRGRLWISARYYDEEGTTIEKPEIFLKDYTKLTKWVKKYVPYQEMIKGGFPVKEYVNNEVKELQESGFVLTL